MYDHLEGLGANGTLESIAGSAPREEGNARPPSRIRRSGYTYVSHEGTQWAAKIGVSASLRGKGVRSPFSVLIGESIPELAVAGDIAAIWRDVRTGVAADPSRRSYTNLPLDRSVARMW